MPPKKPAQPAGSKKTQEKKKEKIIEVKPTRVSLSVVSVSCQANVPLSHALSAVGLTLMLTGANMSANKLHWPLGTCQRYLTV